MFLLQGQARAKAILQSLQQEAGQSRAVLLLGPEGSGKFSAALDFAQGVLGAPPLESPNFLCFRNDRYALKAEYFFTRMPQSPLAWNFLKLLQRRMAAGLMLGETLAQGLKIGSIKEELDEHIHRGIFPENPKTVASLLEASRAYQKKSGIPMDFIREAGAFHSMHSEHGRVSVLGAFDTAEETTQNAALKLLEEPHPNHWIILTACNKNHLIPTILSRVVAIKFSRPRSGDLSCLEGHRNLTHSSLDVMGECVFRLSSLRGEYLREFFTQIVPQIDKGASLFAFAEKLEKAGHGALFLEELLTLLGDTLILRRGMIQRQALPLLHPAYEDYARPLAKGSSAELEDMAKKIEDTKKQAQRPVIRGDSLLPDLFLSIARSTRIFSGR